MKSYSAAARGFLGFVWLLGLMALTMTLFGPLVPGDHFTPLSLALTAFAAAAAGTRKVYLLRTRRTGQSRYVTLGFLVTFATLLALGVRAGVLAGITSAIAADVYTYFADNFAKKYKRHITAHQLLFNVASIAVTAWCAGQVFVAVNGTVGVVDSRALPAVLAAMVTYFLLNTGMIAGIVALCTQQRVISVWRANFLWTFPVHLTGAAYVALALMFIHDVRMILLAASIAPFAYQYYRMYGDHVEQKQTLIDELEAGRESLSDLYLSTVKSLATAIAAKDQYTHSHIHRVQNYAMAVAEKLGVTGDELEAIRTGAVLHDIGKLGVPDYVLLKPGRLTADEYAKMQRHPVVGADILEPVNFPWPVGKVVRHHHERWDGKGYPDELAGEDIPLGARILSVADVYDALTSDRPYRAAWSHEKTEAFLLAESGIQFDPQVVKAFVQVVNEAVVNVEPPPGENGTLVYEGMPDTARQANVASSASRQIGRTASELWVLYEVSQTLNSASPMQERLRLLGQKLTAIMPGTTCAFLLYDDLESREQQSRMRLLAENEGSSEEVSGESDAPLLRVAAAAGLNADLLYARGVMLSNSPSSVAARAGATYRGAYINDGLTWSLSRAPERPIHSILIVPLKFSQAGQQETLGAMTFYHCAPEAFTADDENLLTMIAEQVQTALCQDREYDRTRSDANTDALTGLHNMRYLRQKTAALMRGSSPGMASAFALLYLDLDNFKNINTLYGHPQGSRVLGDVAQLLPRELRPTDIAVRYGGDEFVIVLPQTSEAGACEVADRIRAAVQKYQPAFLAPFDIASRLDVSIGIACFPHDSDSMEGLVAIADQRMYAKKMEQKSRFGEAGATISDMLAVSPHLDTAVVGSVLQERPTAAR